MIFCKNSYAFRLGHSICICTCIYKSERKTPVTPELRPGGDSVASLNNVRHQSTRSSVSYSAVTTQRHLHLTRWDRLKHYKTSCDGAHFWTCTNQAPWLCVLNDLETEWGCRGSTVRSPSTPRELRWHLRNAANRSEDAMISQLHLYRHLLESFGMSLRLYCASTVHPQRSKKCFSTQRPLDVSSALFYRLYLSPVAF